MVRLILGGIIYFFITLYFLSFSSMFKGAVQKIIFQSSYYELDHIKKYLLNDFLVVHNDLDKRFLPHPFNTIQQYLWWFYGDSKILNIELIGSEEIVYIKITKKNFIYDTCIEQLSECLKDEKVTFQSYPKVNVLNTTYEAELFFPKENFYMALPPNHLKYFEPFNEPNQH